tara:strand:- start:230 stop:1855 length:1626 start_codon:yes stop_codon:yes gene_type:complete
MQIRTTYNIVFLMPLVVFVLGLLTVSASTERAQQAYDERYRAGFEADAAVRVLVRDALAERLEGYLRTYVSVATSVPSLSRDEALRGAFSALVQNFGADSSSAVLHFYVATFNPQGRVIIVQSYPREEVVGEDITDHPMMEGFDFFTPPGVVRQTVYRASPGNDPSFSSEGPIAIRHHVFRSERLQGPLFGIVKQNLIEIERYIDRELRTLGPLPALAVTHYDPETGSCVLAYRPDSGEIPCPTPEHSGPLSLLYSSERQGFQSSIRPTETYAKNVLQQQRSIFALTELVLTLLATLVALLAAWVVRSRLTGADEQIDAFQGSLNSKEALTGLIHSTVIDNLEQVVDLARRVKDAPEVGVDQRRYLNIALSEMGQLRLSLDSSIMASRNSLVSDTALGDQEEIDVHDLTKTVQDELQRLAADEGLDCRVLVDDDMPELIRGSSYWVESALLAFINTALNFTDEGFIELALWTEVSLEGAPELCARIRDTGLGWSLEDETLDHPTLEVLRVILNGLGAVMVSSDVSTGTGQEHVIRFTNQRN